MELGATWSSGVPAHGRGLNLDGLEGAFQPKPFYDSMNILGGKAGAILEKTPCGTSVESTRLNTNTIFLDGL